MRSSILLIAFSLIAVSIAVLAEERATCAGSLVNNSDGTVSCVTVVGTSTAGYPISKVTNQNTGVTSYVTQTGVSATGQPIYSVTSTAPASVPAPAPAPVPAPAPAPAPVSCTGSLVNNSDGTRSCVVTVATCPSGYLLYKVTNVNTGVVTYVSQTGLSATGQAIMTPTNQNCVPLSG